MHAVLVTFMSCASLDELEVVFQPLAVQLATTDGLVMETWISDDTIVGGFHIFEDRSSADAYLNSELFEAFLTDPTFVHFRVQHFDVSDHLSAITHCPDITRVTELNDVDPGNTGARPIAASHAPRTVMPPAHQTCRLARSRPRRT
jgi:Putative mono-oxygenase ydhR